MLGLGDPLSGSAAGITGGAFSSGGVWLAFRRIS
ncbi:hypothetical protein VTO73DRAFT_2414 [Trametes versicolor]